MVGLANQKCVTFKFGKELIKTRNILRVFGA